MNFQMNQVAEITEMARAKIERMLLQKYGKSLVEFRLYQRRKFPYLVVVKLKEGTYKMLAIVVVWAVAMATMEAWTNKQKL
jgi:hypothetical protein